jgi:hypothetical protein
MVVALIGGSFGWEVAVAAGFAAEAPSPPAKGIGILLGMVGGVLVGLGIELRQHAGIFAKVLLATFAGMTGAVFAGALGLAVGGMVSSQSVQGQGIVMIVGMVLGAILGGISGARSEPNPAGSPVKGE